MTSLTGLSVLQIGPGKAAAVCGRAFADLGAEVHCLAAERGTPVEAYLDHGKENSGDSVDLATLAQQVEAANIVICQGGPQDLRKRGLEPASLQAMNPNAVVVAISPYGQTGPRADDPASDLTLLAASGIMRILTGQVDDIREPPTRAVGEQSAFIGGLAGACAGMLAILGEKPNTFVDVSIQEALATLALAELTRASLEGRTRQRQRIGDGNGATVTVLPTKDGFVGISPREDHQWAAWLEVMGSPDWGADPRFATKPDRQKNWDALYALISEWSLKQDKQSIADAAQAAHVPSFPLREATEQLESEQLKQRGFYRPFDWQGRTLKAPGPPYGLSLNEDADATPPARSPRQLPLSGVRVLDFSWVIAGPTVTRYFAAMGAEVIKVEAPGRGDPGRKTGMHTVAGRAKKGIVLNLKDPEAQALARALAAECDILVENFGTGVMERFGLGADDLRRDNPGLIYMSASGLGRTGPEAKAVAYGTLLQCYAGFAGLNRQPGVTPRVGFAWLDPMCGLKITFGAAAALWRKRRTGLGARVDYSMIEAMLWTMAEPLLTAQIDGPPEPRGNADDRYAPHDCYACAGDDAWVAIAVTSDTAWKALCGIVPGLSERAGDGLADRHANHDAIDAAITAWSQGRPVQEAAETLTSAGIAASSVASLLDHIEDAHLEARGYWNTVDAGRLPGLPWQSTIGKQDGPPPELGADTEAVLSEVLGLTNTDIGKLRASGALG